MARKLSLSVTDDFHGYREATLVAYGADVDLLVEVYEKAIGLYLPEAQVPDRDRILFLEAEVARLTDLCRPMVGITDPVGPMTGMPLMDSSDPRHHMSATDQQSHSGLPASKLSERLVHLRKSRRLKKTELMAMCGVSDDTIAKAENGETVVRFKVLINIAQAYGVSLDYLMGRSDEPTVPSAPDFANRMRQTIGDCIKAERKRLRLNAVELGSLIGRSGSFIGQMETGSSYPSSVTALHLAHVLGVSIDYLAGLTDDPGSQP